VGLSGQHPTAPGGQRWVGPTFAVLGVLGFSFKAILIKRAGAALVLVGVTLATLRPQPAAVPPGSD
jgi:hypothetical protein